MIKWINLLFEIAGQNGKYIKRMFVYRLLYSISFGLIIGAVLYFLMKISDSVFNKTTLTTNDVFIVFFIMLISVIGRVIFMYFSLKNKAIGQFNITSEKRIKIGNRLKDVYMGYFSENRLGDIVSGLTSVLSEFEMLGLKFFEELFGGFIQTVIMAIGIMFFDITTGIIILITVIIALCTNALFQAKSDRINKKLHELRINLNSDILEYINGIAVIKSFGIGKERFKQLKDSIYKTSKAFFEQEKSFALANFIFVSILKLGVFIIILSSVSRYVNGAIPAYKSILLIVMSFVSFEGFEMTLTVLNIKQMAILGLQKINALETIEVTSSGKLKSIKTPSVEFKNVEFTYDKERKIFDKVNLFIPEYETTALVGSSGSGKTTICNLIARFWDIDKGTILIDGKDIKKYNYDYLLSTFSFVFQDVYLFDDTIMNNIKFGNPRATNDEIIEVSKKAKCHDFITKLKDGYDTKLNEGGSNLSGGEKQRISIARAMLKQSKFVILDEATSSIDPENEEELISAIKELTKNKTVITIAHRLKTVKTAKQILVMDKGKIVSRGNHEELIGQDGLYSHFIKSREVASKWTIQGK